MTPVFTLLHAASTTVQLQGPSGPSTAIATATAATKVQDSEHRASRRHRVLKAAKIVLDDWRSIDCQIRDISETGAKIRVDGATKLPHKFQLVSVVENTIRPVQVAWKLNDTIGVVFRGEATRAPIRKLASGNG
jgi:PilZ domain